MKVGVFVTNQNPLGTDMVSALDDQFAMTRLARDRGWDAVGTGQHYLSEGMSQLQLIPFLARLAAEAGEMTGVAGVLLINLHNPVEVAECIASLDVIWRGNFVFGVGLGYREVEFDAFKVPKGQRLRRFEECLEIVKRLWTEDKVSVETDVCTLSSGCVDDNLDRQFDAGHARIYGLEAFAEDELVWGAVRFPLSLAYTLTLTEFLESFESEDPIFGNVQKGDEMPYVPKHEGRINLGLELAPIATYVSFSYISPMREEAGNTPIDQSLATDEQFAVDAGVSYDLLTPIRTRFYLQARNLLDDQSLVSRRPYGARPNAPRWVQAGAKVEF